MQVQDNLLSSIKQYFDRILAATDTPKEEYRPLFKILVQEILGRPSSDVLLADQVRLTESEILKMLNAIKGLRSGTPIQYIIGHTDFYNLRISCDERALIPRPETEELVRWVIESSSSSPAILDIGTGSGCIALALAHNKSGAQVQAVDYSPEALTLARSNADRLELDVKFTQDNILKPSHSYQQYDIIVSNPPYVRELEKAEMHERVLAHEPHMALFVDDESPLVFYTAIAELASRHLKTGGQLFFEINEYLGKISCELLEQKGFSDIELRKDLYGKDRMLRSRWNG